MQTFLLIFSIGNFTLIVYTLYCSLGVLYLSIGLAEGGVRVQPRSTEDIQGYKNPHEEIEDIQIERKFITSGRSQIIHGRWRKTGIVIFYSPEQYTSNQQCLLRMTVKTLGVYSCIPIHLFETSKACVMSKKSLTCALESKDVYRTSEMMIAAGVKPNVSFHPDYIVIGKYRKGCSSAVGRTGHKQRINYDSSCFKNKIGSLLHEMLHSIGYNHEHTRSDRDNYVFVNKSNIKKDHLHNFLKGETDEYKDYGPYDFESLMHYSSYAFAKSTAYRTITIKNHTDASYYTIGQRRKLTIGDKAKIRAVSKCPGSNYEEHVEQVKQLELKEGMGDISVWEDTCDE